MKLMVKRKREGEYKINRSVNYYISCVRQERVDILNLINFDTF
jgi:hypothetical protein